MTMTSKAMIGFAVFVGLPVLHAGTAQALPNQRTCRITTYYQEQALTHVVGSGSTCTGGRLTGRRSPYSEVETLVADRNSSPSPSGSGSGLPCEFASGSGAECRNLPQSR